MQKQQLLFKPRKMAVIGLLSSISILLSLTPLGFIPIPPLNPTIMHVPVIIGAIIEGPLAGGFIGGIFGLSSLIRAFMTPTPTNFIFWNPLISIGVRILIGVVSAYLFKALKNRKSGVAITAIAGTLVNTVGVLGLAYFFYLSRYSAALGITENAARTAIFTLAATNGIPEAIVSTLIVVPVVAAYQKIYRKL